MATSRRKFIAGAGAAVLTGLTGGAASAQDVIRDIIQSPRRGNWDTEFDARATQAGKVASTLPIFSPETVTYIERAIAQYQATALIGPEAAMACTAAVEEEIDRHYSRQLEELDEAGNDAELRGVVAEFREDERAHRDAALAAGAEQAPAYPLLHGAIRLGCRLAIRLSERI